MRCSLIIPVYNAESTIADCLRSSLHQSLSLTDYEIIVVDDGSTDNTAEIAKDYPVRLIHQKNQGPATARNLGANHAEGSILVFTDSDCELDFYFIEKIIAPIEHSNNIVGVQGSYKTKQKQFIARFGQVEIETRYNKIAKKEFTDFIGTYSAAYRKDIFLKYGKFDTGFPLASGEDAEFSYKLHENGHKMVFEPQAFVYHQHPFKLSKYLKVKFYRGYWRIRLYRKHPQKTINDSYTPQTLKLEIICIPLMFLFSIMSLFNYIWLVIPLLMTLLYIFSSIPFFRLFREKKYTKSILIPIILVLRATTIFWGMVFGLVNEFRTFIRG